jgi:protein O-GlcNAc transferase
VEREAAATEASPCIAVRISHMSSDPRGLALAQAMQQAIACYRGGQWLQAEQLCRAILERQASHFEALNLLGIIATQTGRAALAADLFHQAVTARPESAVAHVNYGNALQISQRYEAALHSYERAVQLEPHDVEAWVNLGDVQQKLHHHEAALESYEQALKLRPEDAAVCLNRGVALNALRRFDAALASYQRALQLKPDYADAYVNRGNVQRKLKHLEAALESYDRALQLRPDDVETCVSVGDVQRGLRRMEAALASYDRALKLRPDYAPAYNGRGVALHETQQFEAALASYERALSLKPDDPDAYNNCGVTLHALKRFAAAEESYQRALKCDPDFAEAYLNRANLLYERNLPEAALHDYESALRLRPDYAEAYSNRAQLLKERACLDAALESHERALSINRDVDWLLGAVMHTRMHLCAWQGIDAQLAELTCKIEQGRRATPPFPLVGLIDSLLVQRQAAETWVRELFPAHSGWPPIGKRRRAAKIRLGYYSSDFYEHATTHLITELFERHDRSRFELTAFSFGAGARDEVTRRIAAAFDRFLEVATRSDQEIARLCRELEIDIAVDLKGHTREARTGIFAQRAAPVQVNYLGYPGTMGAPYFDYIVADRTLIPADSQHGYAEKICFLPDSYQVNDRRRRTDGKSFTRAELGLPPAGFVFCCFNNVYKITPATFACWCRILERVEGSVLWLLADSETAMRNLRAEATARNLSPSRLVFAARMPLQDHLARHAAADLFLDTAPCNAHTTASDALWSGLPVITCAGQCFAARVAASLLRAIGLPELITTTQDQYEALAVKLASTPSLLAGIRAQLERNRLTAPLFDTARFTKHLEDAYAQMYERNQAGLSPDHIFVPG